MIIGVTGLIGSGKSEVATVFGKLGAKILDCDAIGKEVVDSDKNVLYKLVLEFGDSILTRQKRLDRRQLGRLAFSSIEKTELLNSIVHPPLLKRLDELVTDVRRKKYHAAIDAALLIYWNYHTKIDHTVLVSSTAAIRFERLQEKGSTLEEIRQRNRSQQTFSHLRKRSDSVITNNKDLSSLHKKAEKLYRQLTESS
jgi:dephospho-CoA kinase